MILSYLKTLEDVLAFDGTCWLFHCVVQDSAVWPHLLDNRFGKGRSTTIAQSRVTLQSWYSAAKVDNEELDRARRLFFRSAQMEYLKLHFIETFREKKRFLRVNELENWSQATRASLQRYYWGAAVLEEEGKQYFVVLASLPPSDAEEQEADVGLKEKAVFWRGLPVVPFDCFREAGNKHNVIARLYGRKGDILLAASNEDIR